MENGANTSRENSAQSNKSYHAPQIVRYGTVASLTKGGSGNYDFPGPKRGRMKRMRKMGKLTRGW